MRLKYQYALFIILIHSVLTALVYVLLREQKWYFILSELAIGLSLFISHLIYNSLIRPIDLMKTGVNAIKDEDFNVKFLDTRSTEMNELIYVFNTMLDKLGQERVRTQEQAYFLERLINASPVGMIILDYDGRLSTINAVAKGFLKVKQYDLPQTMIDIKHPLSGLVQALEVGESKVLTYDGVHKYKCQVSSVIHRGFDRKFIMIEELSKELLESERAAYGKVIRMMAHEVNNSMGAVNSILQSVIDFGFDKENEEDEEYISSLTIAKERNEDLALFMKNFAEVIRLPPPQLKPVDLAELVYRTSQSMRPIAQEHAIQIQYHGPSEGILLNLDAAQINQVIVNIIKNAIESIGHQGTINVTVDEGWPQLIIGDDGPGIPEDVQPNLFSPFFSTKPTGQGIGLVIIRDILVNHDATFSLLTDRERGVTEFKMSF